MTGIISSYTSSGVNSGCMSGISNTIQDQVSGTSNSVQDVSVSGRRYDTFEKSQTSSESSAISYSAYSAKSAVSNTGTSTAVTYGSNSAASPSAKLDSDNRELTDSEYEKLAADLAGIDIDAYGNRNCTYEETLKFGEILTRLHKQKITVNTSQQEAAAAAAGVGYKNNQPQIKNLDDCKNYGTLLKNLREANESVISSAGGKANETLVGDIVKGYGSLSEALTGKYNNEFENYLIKFERQFGTKWVSENIFGGDKSKYDPVERAKALGKNNINVDDEYVYQSLNYGDNCCKAATAMLAAINSNGSEDPTGTYKIGDDSRLDRLGAEKYSLHEKGFFEYKNLSTEELNLIIKSEIDAGNAVMLHTEYAKNEHWVIVTSYKTDENGNIIFSNEDGKSYPIGLGGVDPEEEHDVNVPQKTDNLGKNATVDSSGGQWLHSDRALRVYHP